MVIYLSAERALILVGEGGFDCRYFSMVVVELRGVRGRCIFLGGEVVGKLVCAMDMWSLVGYAGVICFPEIEKVSFLAKCIIRRCMEESLESQAYEALCIVEQLEVSSGFLQCHPCGVKGVLPLIWVLC